ncbi:MAG: hypothetical protein IAA31_06095 [Candidatus Anaerobiospirillum merdipullorum]|uniref:Hpt domain-containing protein n=1 Tax=Candidatus Anaerobiospirillum merdipullorum TaxID=2838450 RepID=A0A9E2NU49_9GAMM|nr:hypothetical protein [Candidatus Anaerobiospirillum merdipullorum]
MHLPQLAAQLAINLPQALERFGHNEALYIKYLKLCPQETTFSDFRRAISTQDSVALAESAHALKGLCGNLGQTSLQMPLAHIVQLQRHGDAQGAMLAASALQASLERTLNLLSQLEN